MSGLPPVGGSANLDNAAQFIRDAAKVNAALQDMASKASNVGQAWTVSARVVDRASNTTVTSTLRIPRAATQAREAIAALGRQATTSGGELSRAGKHVDSFEKSLAKLGKSQRELGSLALGGLAAGVAASTAAVVGLGAAATAMGAQFQKSFNAVSVFSEGSATDLEELRKVIFELGRGPGAVGVNELTAALSELSRGGVSARDQINGAAKAVRDLSIASQGELPITEAAVLMASAMKTFQLEGAGAVDVANAIAAVAQTSTANINDLALSIRQGGQAANLAGFSIQETAAIFGVLAENSLKGADAGTAFKSAFLALVKPGKDALDTMKEYNVSLFDAQGNILEARQLVEVLNRAFGDQQIELGKLTEAQRAEALARIFSSDGVRAAIALAKGGTEAYDEFRAATERLTAATLAQQLSTPLIEQLKTTKNNIEAIGIAVGGVFVPAIQAAVGALNSALQSVDLEPLFSLGEAVRLVATGDASIGVLVELISQLAGADAANAFAALVAGGQALADLFSGVLVPATQHFVASLGDQALKDAPNTIGDLVAVAGAATGVFVALLQIGEQVAAGFRSNSVEAQVLKAALIAITAAPIIALGVAFGALLLKVALVTAAVGALVFIGSQIADAFNGGAEAVQASSVAYDTASSAADDATSAYAESARAAADIADAADVSAGSTEALGGALADTAESAEEAASGIEGTANTITGAFTEAAESAAGSAAEIGVAAHGASDEVASAGEGIVNTHAAVDIANAAVAGSFIHNGEVIATASHAAATEVANAGKTEITALGAVASATTPVGRAFATMGQTIVNIAQGIVNAVVDMARGVARTLLSMLGPLGEIPEVAGLVQGAMTGLAAAATAPVASIRGLGGGLLALGQGADAVGGAFDTLGTRIDNTFSQSQRSSDSARAGFDASLAAMRANAESFEEALARIRARGAEFANAARRTQPGGGVPELGFPERDGAGGRERAPARDRAGEQAARDLAAATKQINELFEDLSRSLEKIERETFQRLEAIARKGAEQLTKEAAEAAKDIAKVQAKAAASVTEEIASLDLSRVTRARREALQDQFDDAERFREQNRDREDTDRQARARVADEEARDILERAREVRDKVRDGQLEAFQRLQEDASIARRRAQEDEDDALKRAEEKAKEARTRLDQRGTRLDQAAGFFTIGTDRADAEDEADKKKRERQRKREDENRAFSEAQAKRLKDFRERLDAEERAKRKAEDIVEAGRREHDDAMERARRRFRDQEDRDIRKAGEAATRALDDQLDDEALARRIENIHTEARERIEATNAALAEREQAIRNQTDQEIADVLSRFDDSITDLEGKFLDKVPEILAKGGEAIIPLVDQITSDLTTRIADTTTSIADFAEGLRAVPREFDNSAESIKQSFVTLKDNMVENLRVIREAALSTANELKSVVDLSRGIAASDSGVPLNIPASLGTSSGGGFQHGGIVPGPFGSPRTVRAHGGELFVGVGRSAAILDAIRNLEARSIHGGRGGAGGAYAGGSSQPQQIVNNHYEFAANYAQMQSPVTLDMDLRAVLALTGR